MQSREFLKSVLWVGAFTLCLVGTALAKDKESTPPAPPAIRSSADTNGDGVVDLAEKEQARNKWRREHSEVYKSFADANHDGVVDDAEENAMQERLKKNQEQLKENVPGPASGSSAGPAVDKDNNPPGPEGGAGTNWENPPGPKGGPGASPNRHGGKKK